MKKSDILSAVKKFISPRSLQYQLLYRSLFILSGLLVLIGIFQYIFMTHFLYSNTAKNTMSQVRSMPIQVWENGGTSKSSGNTFGKFPPFGFGMRGSTLSFIDLQGNYRVVFQAPDANPAPKLRQSTYMAVLKNAVPNGRPSTNYQIVTTANGKRNLVVLIPVGRPNNHVGVVQVSTNLKPLQHVLLEQLLIYILLGAGALIVGLLTFLPTLRRTLVPLSAMSASVKRVNAGNLDERIHLTNAQSEVELLALSFNGMLERLSVSFEAERQSKEKMRQFVADASHELRTPITSLHGFVEVLLRGAANQPDQLYKALNTMQGETERLSKLVQDLLTLARLDEERPLEVKEGRLDNLILEMEPQFHILAGSRRVHLKTTAVRMTFDHDKLKQVILNLFQNAVAHTDAKTGQIEVSVTKSEDPPQSAYIRVKDNGTGIAPEHLDQLFERFYRVDTARSRDHGGAGLGLAITKSIVERHGGSITCQSEVGHGTTFIIRLPLYSDSGGLNNREGTDEVTL